APEPLASPQGCCEESQAHQVRGGISGLILDGGDIVNKPLALVPVITGTRGRAHRMVSAVLVIRVGPFRCAGRASCGRRPVVWSAGSGPARRTPVLSGRAAAALAAAGAICSAVAAPAETPRTVALARVVSATWGFCPSTTATKTVSTASVGRVPLS